VELKRVKKIYKTPYGDIRALDGVDLTIPKGSFMLIRGPNGSGKSTLLNMIGCIDKPSLGEIKIKDRPIGNVGDDELSSIRNKMMGYVFQGENVIPHMTALQNLILPGIIKGVDKTTLEKRGMEVLREIRLEDRARIKGTHLSGGEKQRLAMGRALFNHPEILIVDEPTAFLDQKNASLILELLARANEGGATVICTSHNDDEMGDVNIWLKEGRIAEVRSK